MTQTCDADRTALKVPYNKKEGIQFECMGVLIDKNVRVQTS